MDSQFGPMAPAQATIAISDQNGPAENKCDSVRNVRLSEKWALWSSVCSKLGFEMPDFFLDGET